MAIIEDWSKFKNRCDGGMTVKRGDCCGGDAFRWWPVIAWFVGELGATSVVCFGSRLRFGF